SMQSAYRRAVTCFEQALAAMTRLPESLGCSNRRRISCAGQKPHWRNYLADTLQGGNSVPVNNPACLARPEVTPRLTDASTLGRSMSLPGGTMLLATALWTFLRALCTGTAGVALENMALRHQLEVLQRSVCRPRLARCDRIFWVKGTETFDRGGDR